VSKRNKEKNRGGMKGFLGIVEGGINSEDEGVGVRRRRGDGVRGGLVRKVGKWRIRWGKDIRSMR
jgi:hypothetical protein